MTIDQENPEHELDTSRIAELLLVARLIGEHADRCGVGGSVAGTGAMACPVCHVGRLTYAFERRSASRRQIRAACDTPGCIRFLT